MHTDNGSIVYSPTDLCRFISSPFSAWMERLTVENPGHGFEPDEIDAMLGLLQHKGEAYEAEFLGKFKEQGKRIAVIEGNTVDVKLSRTQQAMADGVEIVFQACLELPPFRGYADFLVKAPGDSRFGDYHYEVWDTKLSRSPRPYFAVQLCCYAEMLESVQGRYAGEMAVVLGNGEISRLASADFRFYYQHLKQQFLDFEVAFDSGQMPDPADSREWGRWAGVAGQSSLTSMII